MVLWNFQVFVFNFKLGPPLYTESRIATEHMIDMWSSHYNEYCVIMNTEIWLLNWLAGLPRSMNQSYAHNYVLNKYHQNLLIKGIINCEMTKVSGIKSLAVMHYITCMLLFVPIQQHPLACFWCFDFIVWKIYSQGNRLVLR